MSYRTSGTIYLFLKGGGIIPPLEQQKDRKWIGCKIYKCIVRRMEHSNKLGFFPFHK